MITANPVGAEQQHPPEDELFHLYNMEEQLETRLATAERLGAPVDALVEQLETLRRHITEVENNEIAGA